MDIEKRIKEHLILIYKEKYTDGLLDKIIGLIKTAKSSSSRSDEKWNESDVVFITYGDSIINKNKNSLATLHGFLKKHLADVVTTVHILPFFPYSSDDGFSVIDYLEVNPQLGTWKDIEEIGNDFDLMFDLVINHISSKSGWFQKFLQGEKNYEDYFIDVNPDVNLSGVVRPRSTPLLTTFKTAFGEKHIWTTFSDDQIDLNFSNPEVLVEMITILLVYLEKGCKILRLDAIAFLWKEIGTSCLHLPETHQVVKLIRDIMEYINPGSVVLTETNVPNIENLSYFGNRDEAHMVYQFSLPPLLLYTLFAENSEYLNEWAVNIPELPEDNTFFNFTASHDGIGVRPLEGLLPDDEKQKLFSQILNNGGQISTKRNTDGTDSPYELNITYFDALKGTKSGPDELQEKRFLCSQTIMASMKGIPAFYIHSFTATKNYMDGVNKTGRARTINRMRWNEPELIHRLQQDSHNSRVFNELISMLHIRKKEKAFHPSSKQEIIPADMRFFIIKRTSRAQNEQILSVSNITKQPLNLDLTNILNDNAYTDLFTGNPLNENLNVTVNPYQTLWLKSKN